MSEPYLILIVGAIAGIVGSLLGGNIIYRNRLKTHLMFKQRVEQELTSFQNDISDVDKKELFETSAGRDLINLLNVPVQEFEYPQKNHVNNLRPHNHDLLIQIENTKKRLSESEEQLEAITALQNESQKAFEKLQQENEELRILTTTKKADAIHSSQLENELQFALEDVARLQNQLAEVNKSISKRERTTDTADSMELAEVVTSSLQELREPLLSIVGYADLLLGESVGVLVPLQRKFAERMKVSAERIANLMDNLIKEITLESGLQELKPEPVNLNLIIDNAVSFTNDQISNKNLLLHVDQPKNMAPVYADREALQHILIHLLQNAGAASPSGGNVYLKVQPKTEDNKEYILIQVSDTGEGIPAEDLGRIFTRFYQADNVLIQGLGDPSVGLSLVKTLTEAHKGRIWVESESGIGSTFSVLIPLSKASS